MDILKTKTEISNRIKELKSDGKTIGFVPTMGALHKGHLSLIECSQKKTDITVVSIFVNPTQFNNPNDLDKYPRTIEDDINKLQSVCTDILFMPNEKEMYPEKDTRKFNFGNLETVMEGEFREGHFNGVAQIVSKLFDDVMPNKAFFGLKDFQQYVVIKELVRKFMPETGIEIIGCPIIREEKGLAMSSRNELLTSEQRKHANSISEVLLLSKKDKNKLSVEEIKSKVVRIINLNQFLEVEYFDIVDDVRLEKIKDWDEKNEKVGCIAVFCGSVRLIDNIYYTQ
jgi:pantoate--beta-alanine ligase